MVMTIGKKRRAAKLTQTQLSTKMGVSQSVVANWETEVALPRTRELPRLARVLECTIDELFDPAYLEASGT